MAEISFPEPKKQEVVKPLVLGDNPPLEPNPEDKPPVTPPDQDKLAEAVRNSLKSRLRGQEPKKEEVKKEEEPKKPEVKKEEKAPEPEPKKTTRKPKEESDAVKIAASAAETAKAALEISRNSRQEPKKPEPVKQKEDPFAGLPEQYQEDIPILQAMEKKYPGKYNGISQKFAQAASRAERYQQDWEKENPGKEFDSAAEEHNAFFEKNDVTWNDKDYQRAMASIEAESLLEKDRKKNSAELDRLKAKEIERDLEPSIHRTIGAVSKSLLADIDKDFEKLINDDGQIVKAEAERLREADPEKFSIIMTEASGLAKFIRETEKLFHDSGKFDFDEKNYVHKEIYDFAMAQEGYLKDLSADQQRNDKGQMFATRGEYATMTADQRKRFWQLEKEDLQFLRGELSKDRAKKMIDAEEKRLLKYAERRGFKPANDPKAGKKEEDKIDDKPKAGADKPAGPSGATGGKIASAASGDVPAPTDFKATFKDKMKGR